MLFGLRNEIVEELKCIAQKYDYDFYVFGSRARGDYKRNSDIDIAVVGNVQDDEKIKIQIDFDSIDMEYMLDVVFVEDLTNRELIKNIEKEGVLIKWKDLKKEEKIWTMQ